MAIFLHPVASPPPRDWVQPGLACWVISEIPHQGHTGRDHELSSLDGFSDVAPVARQRLDKQGDVLARGSGRACNSLLGRSAGTGDPATLSG